MNGNELKQYLSSTNVISLLVGIFFSIFGGWFILVLRPRTDEPTATLLMGLFMIVMGAVLIWSCISNAQSMNKLIAELEARGELDRIVEEFNSAEVLVKGKVRLGPNYIFGKGAGHLVRYENIRQVYQYVKKRNFSEVVRSLKYVDQNGKTRDLCELQLRGKSDEDVKKIMLAILAKNPMVKIGYK